MSAFHSEAEIFFTQLNPRMGTAGLSVHDIFVEQGCTSYVKTIYVGYDIDGTMVTALYGRADHVDHVEVALALDENHESSLLIDASHLTWRTLPVAGVASNADQVELMKPLTQEACARIRDGAHAVNRDNEFFMKSRRERRGQ